MDNEQPTETEVRRYLLLPHRRIDWQKHIAVWIEMHPDNLVEEFEHLRQQPKFGIAHKNRMKHIEEHLDKGELLCRCSTQDNCED